MTKEEAITCKNCKHRPIDDHGSIEPPYDMENGRLDETCPCINKSDWHYSYVPEDEFFCAYVEKKSVTPVHKKSKWIFTKTILDKYGSTVECPSCHKKWKTYDEIRFEKENKYCPNCGEKMEDGIMIREEVNTIDIPKNTTNGDMIKAIFPNAEITEIRGTFEGNLLGYICNYMNMTDKEIYSKLKKLYDLPTRFISVDLPAKDSCRPPETIKKDIKHEKNPMRLKQLNQELNKSYKIYRTRRK